MKKQTKKTAFKSVIRIFLLVICGAIIGLNVYSANANGLIRNELPTPFGYGVAVILSGSMEPSYSKGDLIVVKETDSFSLNDVVVYQDGRSLVVHRIIEINEEHIVTKGDANNTADEPIDASYIKGKVIFFIPYVGSVIEFIKTPIGSILIIGLSILLLEIPRSKERKKDSDELEKIKEEIRRLKSENES